MSTTKDSRSQSSNINEPETNDADLQKNAFPSAFVGGYRLSSSLKKVPIRSSFGIRGSTKIQESIINCGRDFHVVMNSITSRSTQVSLKRLEIAKQHFIELLIAYNKLAKERKPQGVDIFGGSHEIAREIAQIQKYLIMIDSKINSLESQQAGVRSCSSSFASSLKEGEQQPGVLAVNVIDPHDLVIFKLRDKLQIIGSIDFIRQYRARSKNIDVKTFNRDHEDLLNKLDQFNFIVFTLNPSDDTYQSELIEIYNIAESIWTETNKYCARHINDIHRDEVYNLMYNLNHTVGERCRMLILHIENLKANST